jgi:hypothetical protein
MAANGGFPAGLSSATAQSFSANFASDKPISSRSYPIPNFDLSTAAEGVVCSPRRFAFGNNQASSSPLHSLSILNNPNTDC